MLKKIASSQLKNCVKNVPKFHYNFNYKDGDDRVSFVNKDNNNNVEQTIHSAFFNQKTAGLKRELNGMEGTIKSWHEDFKRKHGRKPNLQDMQKDPEVGSMVKQLRAQKDLISNSIQRWRFN